MYAAHSGTAETGRIRGGANGGCKLVGVLRWSREWKVRAESKCTSWHCTCTWKSNNVRYDEVKPLQS